MRAHTSTHSKQFLGDAQVSLKAGRSASYEIEVNSVTIFSKLATGQFPDDTKVLEEIIEVSKGAKKPEVVTETDRGCTIL
ncbi:hypothetical protein EB796_011619 [Bugula neritina]|uniref:Uncharacterized protein n=1 Tax=Bugula neritina TaxID=10212 RepID=A0A7J7JXL0_BUGNE|nr:hypothetical protein EB796_011619 [Bugula neritina]